MKVAYVFISPRAASHKLGQMILPQLEAGTHGAEVVGMFCFDDNVYAPPSGRPGGRTTRQIYRTERDAADDVRHLRIGTFTCHRQSALVR